MKLIFLFAITLLISREVFGGRSKTAPSLAKILKSAGSSNVFVSFKSGSTGRILDSFESRTFESRGDQITTIKLALMEHAANSQAELLNFLRSGFSQADFQSFWISNQVYIREASAELVHQISQLPSVASIEEEVESEIMKPIVESPNPSGTVPTAEEWGVSLIQAPEAWGLDGGNNGENVVIATVDTGVRITHEALKGNFLGEYGWYDPYSASDTPNDQNGHGTHVTGTIAGQGGIGVAPGAKWMACRGCGGFFCQQSALLACGQFILCPTDPQGQNADCSKAPHLVSNSWGGGQGRPDYRDMIDAWISAGIVPLFSNGNAGPSCGSANSPADHKGVIGVGSTTSNDELSSFSSVGPSYYGDIKPDVSAPGSYVRSAYNTHDTAYEVLSGTSMACPHAAGVVALLKGRDQKLSIDTIKTHLFSGIDRDVIPTGRNCGGISEDKWPNNAFGHGRVNAFKALVSLLQSIPNSE